MDNEKDHVVIKNGQRASGLVSEQEAKAQADKMRQQINEKAGQPTKESQVQVKRNLFG
jgi:hypothetical protein